MDITDIFAPSATYETDDYFEMDSHTQCAIINSLHDHSFDGFLGKANNWYSCKSCEQLLRDMIDLYDLERVEYIVNLYESGMGGLE